MRILVNHLTRMQPGWICFAGIEAESGRHIRPVHDQPLTRKLLSCEDGPLALGRLIELGDTEFRGQVPEIEDRFFSPEQIVVIREAPHSELHRACAEVAARKLGDIFGGDLHWINRAAGHPGTAAVDEQTGIRSLGCYWASDASLQIDNAGDRRRVRLMFTEEGRPLNVPVTDIRVYQADHVTPDEPAVQHLISSLQGENQVLLTVGLSRAWRRNENQPARHWLQINNVITPR